MATYRTAPAVAADIITYRYDGKLVFVKPAVDYEQAIEFAQQVFPDELADVSRDRILFTVMAVVRGERSTVRISEFAWPAAVAKLLRGEVIDIQLRPDPSALPPPQYLDVPDSKEALEFNRRSPRSCPSSPNRSRQASPSGRSVRSTHDKSKSWFGIHFSS